MPRTKSNFSRTLRIATALKYHDKKLPCDMFKVEAVLYGLYVLRFDPMCFNSASTAESDFFIEVDRGLEPIATSEVISQYITDFIGVVQNMDESHMTEDGYFKDFIEPLFNFKYPGDNPKRKLIEFLKNEVNK